MARKKQKSSTSAQVSDSIESELLNLQGNSTTDSDKLSSKFPSKTRNFATILYEESANPDWLQILRDEHLTGFARYHDKDVNPDGTQKKPHWHLLLMFECVKNFDRQVKPIFDRIGAVGREIVQSARGYARYLCHLDNPEKQLYNKADVIAFGGADYEAVISLPTDDINALREIFDYIRNNEILSFAEICDATARFKPEWFSIVATRKTYVIKTYLKSYQWERENNYVRREDRTIVNNQTGEIIEKETNDESNN